MTGQQWHWKEGIVNTAHEHMELYYRDKNSSKLIAIIAPPQGNSFTVQFLMQAKPSDTKIIKMLGAVKKDLANFLVERANTNSEWEVPWEYLKYYTTTQGEMRGKVGWSYFPEERTDLEFTIEPATEGLLMDISNCPNFGGKEEACKTIINTQEGNADKYLPVPWQGHIEQAKILFISSNPSPLKNGCLPTDSWFEDSEKIIDFFECRFDPREDSRNDKWTEDYIHYRRMPEIPICFADYDKEKGKYVKTNWVRYWAGTKKRAEVMFNRKVIPGKDYAITELVHCYSDYQVGVPEAKNTCGEKYFEAVLALPRSEKVVLALVGDHVIGYFNARYGLNLKFGDVRNFQLQGKRRLLVALPHPDYWAEQGHNKSLEDLLTADDLKRVQVYLHE